MKTRIKYKRIYIISLLAFILSSCEEKINLILDKNAETLVVEGYFSDSMKIHTVKLSKTTEYFYYDQTPIVTGAIVEISDGSSTFILSESPANSGIYVTQPNVQGIPGHTYTLTVRNVDMNNDGEPEIYTAQSYMPENVYMDSVGFQPSEFVDDSTDIIGWEQDPPSKNFYQWLYYKNGILETDTLREMAFTDDVLVNGNYIAAYPYFIGKNLKSGDTVTIETRCIEEGYYDFILQVMLSTDWNAGNFSGPPANPRGNISGGARGYFVAYSVNYKSGIVP